MTFEDLTSIHSINIEIKKIKEEIANLRQQNFYTPNFISDMPRGNKERDMLTEFVDRTKQLEDMLNYSLQKLQKKRLEIEEFINGIEDNETRLIARLRCINNMEWMNIGAELGMDRRTASRKFYKCLERMGITIPMKHRV